MRFALIFALSTLVSPVEAQVGVTICACQPSIYTFRFNFSAFCEIQTIDSREGVLGADCFARGIGLGSEETVDAVPVQVTTVSVLELDKQLRVLAQTQYVDDFRNGDTFTYTSLAASLEGIATLDPDRMPGGIQLDMVGINQEEQPITNVWVILFENDCNIFPVLEIGDTVGWTILDDLTKPRFEVCPISGPDPGTSLAPAIAAQPSMAPSEEPSQNPVSVVVDEPTLAPVDGMPVCIPIGKGKGDKGGKGSNSNGKGGKSGKGGKAGDSKASDDRSSYGKGKAGGGKSGASSDGSFGKGGKGDKGGRRRKDRNLEQHPTLHQLLKYYGTDFSAVPRKVGHDGSLPNGTHSSSGKGKGSYGSYSSSGKGSYGKGKGSQGKSGPKSSKGPEECIEVPPKKTKPTKEMSTKLKLGKSGSSAGKGKGGMMSGSSSAGKGKGGMASSGTSNGKGKGGTMSSESGKGKGGMISSSSGKGKAGIKKKTKDKDASKEKFRDSSKESPLLSSSKGKGDSSKTSSVKAGKSSQGKGVGKGASSPGSMDNSSDDKSDNPPPNTILPRNSAEEPTESPTPAPSLMTMFAMNMEFLAQSKKKWQEYLEKENNNRLRK